MMILDIFAVMGIFSLVVWLCIGIYKTTYFIEQLKYSMSKTDRIESIIDNRVGASERRVFERITNINRSLLEEIATVEEMIPKQKPKAKSREA